MCLVTHYRDFHCNHHWAVITTPCFPGMGFDNCPSFFEGQAHPLPKRLVALGERCPKCDLANEYDRNRIRMVKRVSYGVRWGLGPSETDPGCDFVCCVM
ncbi:uncharacterized protein C8A04DRAFT_13058 [Dichotomopilus funicola]|uniref:Uncharacterized protein n=1 Tax=Dichotomopilus funicola TaxID=1934379 RepID=A0AAN6V0J2_9PEZI|nr:hypothetical protein C8A04DRAFT_13058 [Dichotomopilus funicola]